MADDAHHLDEYVADEQNAVHIRSFEPELIPGLLQVEGTARAMADIHLAQRPESERARFVRARMERAELLAQPDAPRFSVLVSEAALRMEWASPAVRREQLDVLADALDGRRPNVDLRIVPASWTLPPGTRRDAFVVMSLKDGGHVVWWETADDSERVEDELKTKRTARAFAQLTGQAYPPDRARELIKEIQKPLG